MAERDTAPQHDTGRRVKRSRDRTLRVVRTVDGRRLSVDDAGVAGAMAPAHEPASQVDSDPTQGTLTGRYRGNQQRVVTDGGELTTTGSGDSAGSPYIEPTLPDGAGHVAAIADGVSFDTEADDDGAAAASAAVAADDGPTPPNAAGDAQTAVQPAENGDEQPAEADELPERADELIAWIGDDAGRARRARAAEHERPESRQRSTVLDYVDGVLRAAEQG